MNSFYSKTVSLESDVNAGQPQPPNHVYLLLSIVLNQSNGEEDGKN